MEPKKNQSREKLGYEKPEIKEEVVLEQKALACAVGVQVVSGGVFDCVKNPTTPATVTS